MGSWRPDRVSWLRGSMGTGTQQAFTVRLSRRMVQADVSGLGTAMSGLDTALPVGALSPLGETDDKYIHKQRALCHLVIKCSGEKGNQRKQREADRMVRESSSGEVTDNRQKPGWRPRAKSSVIWGLTEQAQGMAVAEASR